MITMIITILYESIDLMHTPDWLENMYNKVWDFWCKIF